MLRASLIVALTALMALAGCSTTANLSPSPLVDLRKGSSTADLIAALGEPKSIEPDAADPNVDIWTYEAQKTKTEMVGVDTQEIPYVDPITGEQRTLIEPVYRPQTTTLSQIIKVLVADEKVIDWKVETDVDRDIVE